MAGRKHLGHSPPPAPDIEQAEKTEVSFMPEFDLDDPTEDTDEHELPKQSPRLRLPLPVDPEPRPEPPPAPRATPLPPLEPAPVGSKPQRIPLFTVEPERSSSGLMLGVVAALFVAIAVAFALAPDGDRERRTPKNLAFRSNGSDSARAPGVRPGSPGSNGSPGSLGSGVAGSRTPPARAVRQRAPVPQRHAQVSRTPGRVEAAERYGFERVEQPRRLYDNYDSSQDTGNGIPMLMVFSKPSGMSVDLDGKLAGMTPLIRPLPKDTKRVKVRVHGAGFKEWEQTVTPNQIEQFRVGVTMQPIAE